MSITSRMYCLNPPLRLSPRTVPGGQHVMYVEIRDIETRELVDVIIARDLRLHCDGCNAVCDSEDETGWTTDGPRYAVFNSTHCPACLGVAS